MNNTPKSGIYLITNTINNKEYIGKDIHLSSNKRWRSHKSDLKSGRHRNSHLQHSWNKYSESAFVYSPLEYCEPEDLVEREKWWMDLLRTLDDNRGYNKRDAEEYVVSEETRAKMSASHIGNTPGNKGKKHTLEARAKMSAALRGKPKPWVAIFQKGRRHSEETKARMSAVRKGKSKSPEWSAKIGAANRGKGKPWSESRWAAFRRKKGDHSAIGY